jgi:hypothetical protein
MFMHIFNKEIIKIKTGVKFFPSFRVPELATRDGVPSSDFDFCYMHNRVHLRSGNRELGKTSQLILVILKHNSYLKNSNSILCMMVFTNF